MLQTAVGRDNWIMTTAVLLDNQIPMRPTKHRAKSTLHLFCFFIKNLVGRGVMADATYRSKVGITSSSNVPSNYVKWLACDEM